MWKDAKWLKLPKQEIEARQIYHGDMTGRFAYFRCEAELPKNARLTADITANSRYRLWVNGQVVQSGPCKGDAHRQYYETLDLTPYLTEGQNCFCAQVLYCDPDTAERQTDERASIYGVIGQRCGHRFAMEGDILNENGDPIGTVTTGKADWRVWLDSSFYLKSSDITLYLGAVTEHIDCAYSPMAWKQQEFDASGWLRAEPVLSVALRDPLYFCGVEPQFRMRQREIPLMYEKEDTFASDFCLENGKTTGLLENGSVQVLPGQQYEVILDAGVIKNGYPKYTFQGGCGAKISITYFEKFGGQGADLRRTDYKNGAVSGLTDTLVLSGENLIYEPFWVRTFRFVRLTVQAADTPVTVYAPTFRKTGYPLPVESSIRSSESWIGKLWELCVRTLENCMLETYMDCPYYEQLQFAMDTRLEALFTYAASSDPALARKALIDFHYGMLPDGLTTGKYPSVYLQVLSTFSLHYIYMLWEYYRHTADMDTVRICRCDMDRILDYYDQKIGADGLVGRLNFWEFVDWQDAWMDCGGTPRALESGPSTIINLMYAYALHCAAQLNAACGRTGLVEEYDTRRKAILERIQQLCWDDDAKLYREGPCCSQFTRHAQSWAVLNEMVDGEGARTLLEAAIQNENCLQCTFSTSYEWFCALEKAGLYRELRDSLNDWIGLLELECTTCPETPHGARSDCHAWSALPMYTMMRTIAGVQNVGIGWDQVEIYPHLMDLKDAEGTVITPRGTICFRYQKLGNGLIHYDLTLPKGMNAVFRFQNGEKACLTEEKIHLSESI